MQGHFTETNDGKTRTFVITIPCVADPDAEHNEYMETSYQIQRKCFGNTWVERLATEGREKRRLELLQQARKPDDFTVDVVQPPD